MKKRGSTTRFLIWVMVIWLHAFQHLSIAAELSNSNGTTSTSLVCDGSVEDCLNVHHLESQLPTISSSHFRRILAGGGNGGVTKDTKDPQPFLDSTILGYRRQGNRVPPGGRPDPCANKDNFRRDCHNIDLP